MYNATEQLAEINKAGYDNAVKLAALSLEKAERLTKLNLQAAKVALERDPSTFSLYRWTSGKGPPILLSSGTLTRAEVTTREQRPIDLVIPLTKRLTGIGG